MKFFAIVFVPSLLLSVALSAQDFEVPARLTSTKEEFQFRDRHDRCSQTPSNTTIEKDIDECQGLWCNAKILNSKIKNYGERQ